MSESQLIEYKESWRDEYLKWICWFSNAQGGELYISIDDKGKTVGVQNAKKLMSKHSSEPYNPHIAHVFYLAGMIESWGRGIEKICETCQREKSNPPVYTIDNRELMVKFSTLEGAWNLSNNASTGTANDTVNAILALIKQNPTITYEDLTSKIGKSRRTISRVITELKNNNILIRVGSDKTGHWEIIDNGVTNQWPKPPNLTDEEIAVVERR